MLAGEKPTRLSSPIKEGGGVVQWIYIIFQENLEAFSGDVREQRSSALHTPVYNGVPRHRLGCGDAIAAKRRRTSLTPEPTPQRAPKNQRLFGDTAVGKRKRSLHRKAWRLFRGDVQEQRPSAQTNVTCTYKNKQKQRKKQKSCAIICIYQYIFVPLTPLSKAIRHAQSETV